MRYADIGGGQIVFTYEDDLWLVPETGGDARRITSHPGTELAAKFNKDGTKLAFTGSYDGGNDVYVMDVMGGVPERLTWHPAGDTMLDWCPDEDGVVIRSNREYPYRGQLFKVFFDGGMPMRLPVDRGSLASVAPDHSGLAYNRIGRQARTWKRYEGGMAQDIWVKDFASGEITKITDWDGTDNFPMWEGGTHLLHQRPRRRHAEHLRLRHGQPADHPPDELHRLRRQISLHRRRQDRLPARRGPEGPGHRRRQVSEVPINIPSDRRHVREELITAEPRTGRSACRPAANGC